MPTVAYEDKLPLKTYLLGPDDPNPPWHKHELIYPYSMQDNITDETAVVDYRALHLENEFLHAIVLPELGGRLYSLYDKIGKRETFYRNNVVKYCLVARRGAWISGGIEFNFPKGHTCVTVAPVLGRIQEDDDGPEITVGCLDRVSRMRWSVGLSLDGAKLVQQVKLENPTPIRQRHYWWSNSAVPATDDLHLVYPAVKARTGGGVHTYPLKDGVDMSWYKNHDHADDIFTLDVQDDFFGCHYVDSDCGLVHWSDHRLEVGKKFFTWGTADDGMIWVDLLTDDDGQYVEIQAGRYVDQSTFEFLFPFQRVAWTEHWWPVRGMGGWNWANEEAALNVQVGKGHAEVGIFATSVKGKGEVILQAGDRVLAQQPCQLKPGRPVQVALEAKALSPDRPVSFIITHGDDEVIRYDSPPDYELRRRQPFVLPPKPEPRPDTPQSLTVAGMKAEQHANLRQARELFSKALALDDRYAPAHVGVGLLDYRAGLYEAARAHFQQAADADPECDEAAYYLALALRQLGECDEAERQLALLIGRSACRREAVELLDRLGCRAGSSPVSVQTLGEGMDRFMRMIAMQTATWEPGAITGEAEAEEAWEQVFRLPDTAWRQDLIVGQLDVLAASPHARRDPLVYYHLACHEPQRAAKHMARLARVGDPAYCFPSRLEDLPVLEHAVAANPQDWLARLLLGDLLAHLDRRDEALATWQEAAKIVQDGPAPEIVRAKRIPPALATLYRNIGLALSVWREQHTQALKWYDRAIAQNPDEYHLHLERDEVTRRAALSPEQRLRALDKVTPAVAARREIATRRVDCLVALGRWHEALDLLGAHWFKPWEGARQMHGLWVQAHLGLAAEHEAAEDWPAALACYEQALTYPRNLGVGKLACPNEAKLHWLAYEAATKAGDDATAQAHLQAAADERQRHPGEATQYKIFALRQLGRKAEARTLATDLRRWARRRLQEQPDDWVAQQVQIDLGR